MPDVGNRTHERRAHVRGATAPEVRLELDDLLGQLVDRAQEVMRARDRLRGLLQANQAVASEVSLPVLLQRIVESASSLIGARYAALGVLGPGRLRAFIHVGMDEATVAGIGPLPRGEGILGLLTQDPRPLRLPDLGQHVQSVGFPPHHPPMRSFLGVPIRVRDTVFGNLYLTEKDGGGQFTQEDEELVEALAAAAAVAIDNARLFEAGQRRQVYLQASTDVTTALLSGASGPEALALVARRSREVSGADAVAVALPDSDGRFVVASTAGEAVSAWQDALLAVPDSDTAQALAIGEVVLLEDPLKDDGLGEVLRQDGDLTSMLLVPMHAGGQTRGVLALVSFSVPLLDAVTDAEVLAAFGAQAALALELVENRGAREQLTLLEDRERIARNLHDQVIQRLFAVGLGLQGMSSRTAPELQPRVARFIDELDATILEIRATIFGLQREAGDTRLRSRVLDVVAECAPALGFDPHVELVGALDSLVTGGLADDVLAVLREALSNVARHAHATQVQVRLRATGSEVVLDVADDGGGMVEAERRSGLRNLTDRATWRGGSFLADGGSAGGTRLTWRAPLPPDASGTSVP